jgi:signal transduction histidine kinase
VVANLVDNAAKFGGSAGANIRVLVEAGEDHARVEVSDDGPGIPPDQHQRIFDKFGRVEAQSGRVVRGSGLGLTFCKMAVEAHGGRIGVSSDAGRGAKFWLTLPAQAATGSDAATA